MRTSGYQIADFSGIKIDFKAGAQAVVHVPQELVNVLGAEKVVLIQNLSVNADSGNKMYSGYAIKTLSGGYHHLLIDDIDIHSNGAGILTFKRV